MIYPDKTDSEWAEKYGLTSKSVVCEICKSTKSLNTPFIMRGYAGLEMEQHGCWDRGKGPFVVTPITENEIEFWKTVI